jgi:hypothetical protein
MLDDSGPPGVTDVVPVGAGGDGEADPDVAPDGDGEPGAGDVPDVPEAVVPPVGGVIVAAPPVLPCEVSHAPMTTAPSAATPPRRIVRLVLINLSIRQKLRAVRKERHSCG